MQKISSLFRTLFVTHTFANKKIKYTNDSDGMNKDWHMGGGLCPSTTAHSKTKILILKKYFDELVKIQEWFCLTFKVGEFFNIIVHEMAIQ